MDILEGTTMNDPLKPMTRWLKDRRVFETLREQSEVIELPNGNFAATTPRSVIEMAHKVMIEGNR